jgi:hypothetical protein
MEALLDSPTRKGSGMATNARVAALNHRLKAGLNDAAGDVSSLKCECADLRCNATLELTDEERTRRRTHAGRFWVRRGHELESVESVIEKSGRYAVVQLEATPFFVVSLGG